MFRFYTSGIIELCGQYLTDQRLHVCTNMSSTNILFTLNRFHKIYLDFAPNKTSNDTRHALNFRHV
jgi:hypothetical protein